MDRVISIITNEDRTPELPRLIMSTLMEKQHKKTGDRFVSEPTFEWLLKDTKACISLNRAVKTIDAYSVNHRFNPDQCLRLALYLVERFGRPIRDPSHFVAMGGMPADDDVVFVREEKEDGRINNLRQDIGKAKNQVTATKDTAEQARVKCSKLEVRRDECKDLLIKALSDVKEAANDFGIKRHAQAQAERDLQALEAELAKLEPKDQGPAAKRHKP